MSESGRYYITDDKTGRKFWVEPMGRPQEKVFTNGGIDGTAEKNKSTPHGGSIEEKDSVITEDNGFKDIITIGPHMSPNAFIADICEKGLRLNDPSLKHSFPHLAVDKTR